MHCFDLMKHLLETISSLGKIWRKEKKQDFLDYFISVSQSSLSVGRSVGPNVQTSHFTFFFYFISLTSLLLPKWSGDLKYGPCPPARDFGSCVSGLVSVILALFFSFFFCSFFLSFFFSFFSCLLCDYVHLYLSVHWSVILSVCHVVLCLSFFFQFS